MDRARADAAGDIAAWLAAHIVNNAPFRSGPAVTPQQCHPYKASNRNVIDVPSADAVAAIGPKFREDKG